MNKKPNEILDNLIKSRIGERIHRIPSICDELTYEVSKDCLLEVATKLRDDKDLLFQQVIDICGVDYLTYGSDEWKTAEATNSGFSRGVLRDSVILDEDEVFQEKRFAAVYHLLSVKYNWRLRLRVYTGTENPPILPSIVSIWAGANWFEREVFDLFGILFDNHPDLRRIMTDYGFIGHPFRKDFPISGHVEVKYDPDKGRVVYQPVSIEKRTLVPRVIREDNRYSNVLKDEHDG